MRTKTWAIICPGSAALGFLVDGVTVLQWIAKVSELLQAHWVISLSAGTTLMGEGVVGLLISYGDKLRPDAGKPTAWDEIRVAYERLRELIESGRVDAPDAALERAKVRDAINLLSRNAMEVALRHRPPDPCTGSISSLREWYRVLPRVLRWVAMWERGKWKEPLP